MQPNKANSTDNNSFTIFCEIYCVSCEKETRAAIIIEGYEF